MKTALYAHHVALGARIVDFAGWEMPLQYRSSLQEHNHVRKSLGIFDVSHMARFLITGKDAEKFADYISTNRITGKKEGAVIYTVLCNLDGGCIDDVLFYRIGGKELLMVANASNREKVFTHLQKMSKDYVVDVQPYLPNGGILAIQGPRASELVNELFDLEPMRPMKVVRKTFHGESIVISSTGYTGEKGFEVIADRECLISLWEEFMEKGKEFDIAPIGLAARDTLRLEKGYALYGHEISEVIAPTESVCRWVVHLDKEDFLGKESLLNLEANADRRVVFGVVLEGKGVPRQGCHVYFNDMQIGEVTSGTFSPSLQKGICIVLGKQGMEKGALLEVEIRGKRIQGRVVSFPFYPE